MYWTITDKGDPAARALADRHYSRQTPGARGFCRNGQNLVFLTTCARAAWVTFRPTPGVATRKDKLDAWECALFRNVSAELLSSSLIREAVSLSVALWGDLPEDGLLTYVKPEALASAGRPDQIPGYCYRRAGWRRVGESRDGKPMLRAPAPRSVPPLSSWAWRGDRGGRLREQLESLMRIPRRQAELAL